MNSPPRKSTTKASLENRNWLKQVRTEGFDTIEVVFGTHVNPQ